MRSKLTKVGILAGGVVTGLVVIQSYHVREMFAALLLFSIGFVVVAVIILILFLLDRGLLCTLAWTESCTSHAVVRLQQGWVQVEEFGRRHLHHSEQPAER